MTLRAPFPWFGGKSRVASLVWQRFGDVPNYVEPFAGSLAVLLGRPTAPRIETVNDLDCYVANFWRAVAADPEAVARWADWPVNEADLHARHKWLVTRKEWRERMKTDPDHYDARVAGWWLWGIGCTANSASWLRPTPQRSRPKVSAHVKGCGIHGTTDWHETIRSLAERLRRVRVMCGDWSRAVTFDALHGDRTNPVLTGVLLDPPYSHAERDASIYGASETDCSGDVRRWAIANGGDDRLRIALCGYEGEHEMPGSWSCVSWSTQGGWGNSGERGQKNKRRERIWFSPHCLGAAGDMFAGAA